MTVFPGENIAIDTNRNVGASGITNKPNTKLEEQEIRNIRVDEETNALLNKEVSALNILEELRRLRKRAEQQFIVLEIISKKLDCLQPRGEAFEVSDLENSKL